MLKIRLQGTTNDIKWFLKLLKNDKRFKTNKPSDIMDISGSNKYKRVYTEIFRNEEPVKEYGKSNHNKKTDNKYYGTGMVYGYKKKQ